MTEEQADRIINLLGKILDRLDYIESSTGTIKNGTLEITETLERIRRNTD